MPLDKETQDAISLAVTTAVSAEVAKTVATAVAKATAPKPEPKPVPAKAPCSKHVPVRRSNSSGGCDLCGFKIEDKSVHDGAPIFIDAATSDLLDAAITPHINTAFDRHKDMTLCSDDDCKRQHVVTQVQD